LDGLAPFHGHTDKGGIHRKGELVDIAEVEQIDSESNSTTLPTPIAQ